MKNVSVYLRDSALGAEGEKGWNCVLETRIPEVDFVRAGLGQPESGRSTIDLETFSAYLKSRAGDKSSYVLDAWREIARPSDSWCVTMA